MEAGDIVYAKGNDVGDTESPAGGGKDVSDLNIQLAPLVVDPATKNDASVHAVEADDVGCAEKGVGEEAEHAGDGVLGEDVHGVVDTDPVFDCGENSLAKELWVQKLKIGVTFGCIIGNDSCDDS